MKAIIIAAAIFLSALANAQPNVIRATDLKGMDFNQISTQVFNGIVIEFREGDELPMNFKVSGDLLESRQAPITYITIKKSFWLKADMVKNEVLVSFDGHHYKKFQEALSGKITAGTTPDNGVADSIQVELEANVKK
jgi:hypothetical protein